MGLPPAPWPTATDDLDRWVSLVAQHPIWARVDDADREAARVQAAELAVHLAWTRRDGLFRLADDPWQDLEFAGRMLQRVGALIAALPAPVRLSGPEAALLVTVPLVYDTLWATRAGSERSVRPHDLTPSQDASSDRAAFERFAQSYAQPYRRAVAAVTRANAATAATTTGSPAPADSRDSVGRQRDAAEEIGWW